MSSAGFAGLHLLRAALEQKMGNIADHDSLFDSNDSLIHSRPDCGLLAQEYYHLYFF